MLRLKEIRKKNNISQQELAQKLGITQATLSGWENEKYEIDNNSLLKCSELFDVSVDYLLGNTIEPNELSVARQKAKELLEAHAELTFDIIEEKTGVNYGTFKAWCDGYGDYFNNKLYVVADLFNASVDYLLGRDDYVIKSNPQLSSDEENLIQAYRSHPEMQAAVNKMLDIDDDLETLIKIKQNKPNRETTRYATIAAKGHGLRKIEVTEEQHKAAVEALHELENKK